MNYIQQVNAFNDYLMYNQLSTTEIALWHALMHINNKCGWIQEFTVANRTLEQLTGATRPSIARARNSLMQKGLIKYGAQKARQAGAYQVKDLQRFSIQKADTMRDSNRTQHDTDPDTDPDTVGVQNARPLNKHKHKPKQNKNIYKKVIDYLNEKAGTKFKVSSQATQRLINARVDEGFGWDDFKTVIDNKVLGWVGTEYEQYLRPSTLFAAQKFEGYLNEKPKKTKEAADGYDLPGITEI